MPTKVRILTVEEYDARESARRAGERGGSHLRADYFAPGEGYLCPWYYNPARPTAERDMGMSRERGLADKTFLSVAYWRDWSDTRPPLTLFCPNMREWCIDQKANNGPGWVVTEHDGLLTASPSIVVPGFHGWLVNGEFSDDIEGRGINGVPN